jgi:2Fe-2S ferredoxin
MVAVTYVQADGSNQTLNVEPAQSIMEIAIKNSIDGIDADCGGACACATCQVILDQEWFDKLEPASEMEQSMLEFAVDPQPTSRLSCQIKLTPELDGVTVHLPKSQR